MGKNRKTVITIALALTMLMGIYPPYHLLSEVNGQWYDLGYSLIFNPPLAKDAYEEVHVNIKQLLLQYGGLWLIASIFFASAKE